MIRGKTLPRLSFLRGLGTCITLPFLDSMVAPWARAAAKRPCRMAFVYVPNGVMMDDWLPKTDGDSTRLPATLPRILEPLESFREQILVVSGLTQNGGRALGDGGGDHARASASYLTSVHPKKTFGVDLKAGVSVDQVAAQTLGSQTRFAPTAASSTSTSSRSATSKPVSKKFEQSADFIPTIDKPSPGFPADQAEHSRLMFDLLAMAFQADLTRVSTLMLSLEQSNRSYPEIGIPESHHGLSHHQKNPEKTEKIVKINQYHAGQFRYFLEKLKATPDGDGSLLDHSMILYGSGLADGDRHDHDNLPTLLAGGACGTLKNGRHLRTSKETPMANLFVAMLDRMQVPIGQFGDSKGKLDYLTGL